MARNDMEVIMYKILKYMYEMMKQGETPVFEHMTAHSPLMDVPDLYWLTVMLELIDHGFVKGLIVHETKDGPVIVPDRPRLTLEGVTFLHENSGLQKAKTFLGEAFMCVLEQLIKACV